MRDHGTILAGFALILLQVAAQSSNVTTCTPLYAWTLNANNQTPCLVAAFLESVCEGPVEVNTIPTGNHYLGPTLADADLCRCSTVTYSLISACAVCQNRTFLSWTDWSHNCSQVEVAQYLQQIPAQLDVPSWAYLDVTKTKNIFNPILANESLSNPPQSTSAPVPSTTTTTLLSTAISTVTLPSATSPAAAHKKSNAGAIAGGVVGGLVGLVAFALAVLFCLRRRKTVTQESLYNPSSYSTSPPPIREFGGRGATTSPQSISPFPYGHFSKPSDGEVSVSAPTSAVHTTFDSASVAAPAVRVIHRFSGSAEV
ncbi:hypothetical protein FB45DRAFT_913538 [Roridomyces roridus]|uniref:Mid2 domain-containing protein n=1 Tax=Roridomyces roridus TaxID=1738132 RepID=A0AAD7BWT3_9AGAR|nr:hypothetical protein FB45DRAFT_913538 [Roridomyces roridus]